jgi:hypothetical protein
MPRTSHGTVRWQERAAKCGSRWYEAKGAAATGGYENNEQSTAVHIHAAASRGVSLS